MHHLVAVLGSLALVAFPPGGAPGTVADGEERVLIAGGCTLDGCEVGEVGATAELYDPASGRFRLATRSFATATLRPNGSVLIAGGYDPSIGPTVRAWPYRPGASSGRPVERSVVHTFQ